MKSQKIVQSAKKQNLHGDKFLAFCIMTGFFGIIFLSGNYAAYRAHGSDLFFLQSSHAEDGGGAGGDGGGTDGGGAGGGDGGTDGGGASDGGTGATDGGGGMASTGDATDGGGASGGTGATDGGGASTGGGSTDGGGASSGGGATDGGGASGSGATDGGGAASGGATDGGGAATGGGATDGGGAASDGDDSISGGGVEADTQPAVCEDHAATNFNGPLPCVFPAPAVQPATLAVIKVVINDNNGTSTVASFPLFINGNSVISGEANTLAAGTYTVTETNRPNYTASFSGDCNASGEVALSAGENKTCTITNNDIAPPPPPPPAPPTCVMSANPLLIQTGENTTVSWTLGGIVTSGSISPFIGTVTASGSRTLSLATTTTFIGVFSNDGGQATCQITVAVVEPLVPACTMSANPQT
ncbi:hypothetical protein HY418_01205, partial [Candidatus Kaiserbacteria bacterium]|nr:hypothetical protein [Candidatus Kaiserbacteria bacterium]